MKMNKEEQRVMAIAQRASMIAKHEVTAKDLVEVLSISKNRFKSAAKRLLKEHTALQEAQKRVKAPKVLPRLQGARGKLMDLLRDVPPPTELYHHRYSA
jgi:predicted metal-dependent hydrolase